LPLQPEKRKLIYSRVLGAQKSLHFAVEGMSISNSNEIESVENCLLVKATLDHCTPEVEI